MKGCNKIEMNKATVMEAIQQYLDGLFLKAGRIVVTDFVHEGGNYTEPDPCFTVTLDAVEYKSMGVEP